MVSTDPAKPASVDDSPIIVTEIVVDGRRLVAKEPIRYEVKYDHDDQEPLYTLEGEFDIYEYAFSREMLIDVLHDTLEIMWQDFVEGDPSTNSPRARELGAALGQRFEDAGGAA